MRDQELRRPPRSATGAGGLPTYADAELRAAAALSHSGEHHIPIAADLVAAANGIAIIDYKPMPDDHSEYLVMLTEDGLAGLVVNKRHAETRQRFSIAHGLGHLLLERHAGQPTLIAIANRRSHSYEYIEHLCDHFAACVLMPRTLVGAAWREGIRGPALARRFWVSPQVAEIRVRELGLR